MQQSRLFLCLKTLSVKEYQQLEEYLLSPFLNKNEKLITFFYLIKAEKFDLTSPNLEKSILMRKLFAQNEKATSNLTNLMSQFVNVICDFWQFCKMQEEKAKTSISPVLFDILQERNLTKIWLSKYNKWKKEDEKSNARNVAYFYQKYSILESVYDFTLDYPKEKINVDLQNVTKAFEDYVIFNKLQYACAMLNSSQFRLLETSPALIENITDEIQEKQLTNIPSIKLYHTAFLMLKYPDDVSHFHNLKMLLKKENGEFSPTNYLPAEEAHFIYTLALNYCTGKIIEGDISYAREMFDLYRYLLNEKLLYKQVENSTKKYIGVNHIKNIVTLSIKLKELEWTKQFVEAHRKKVLPALQEDCYKFNMALIYFEAKKYDKVMEILRDIEAYINHFYQIDCRVLLMKTYYETENSELLAYLSENFRKQLTNNKINFSKNRKSAYKNFNTYLLKLCKLREKVHKKKICLDIAKLVASMEKADFISDKQWLFEKVELLKAKYKCS